MKIPWSLLVTATEQRAERIRQRTVVIAEEQQRLTDYIWRIDSSRKALCRESGEQQRISTELLSLLFRLRSSREAADLRESQLAELLTVQLREFHQLRLRVEFFRATAELEKAQAHAAAELHDFEECVR